MHTLYNITQQYTITTWNTTTPSMAITDYLYAFLRFVPFDIPVRGFLEPCFFLAEKIAGSDESNCFICVAAMLAVIAPYAFLHVLAAFVNVFGMLADYLGLCAMVRRVWTRGRRISGMDVKKS